jgi:hypothetical protein
MLISHWILLSMTNVSDKSCRESQKHTFYVPKIVPFMRQYEKMWYSQTGHRWQYNTGHALCMLGNWGCKHTLRIHNTFLLWRQKYLREKPQYCVIRTLPLLFTSTVSFCFLVLSYTSSSNQNPIPPVLLTNAYRLLFSLSFDGRIFVHTRKWTVALAAQEWTWHSPCQVRIHTTRLWRADGVGYRHINYFIKWVGRTIKQETCAAECLWVGKRNGKVGHGEH